MPALRDDQIRRYSRHVLLHDVGGIGQARWLAATVVIDRLDAAGQVAALYLAAAGVGTLVVRDAGVVDAPGPLFLAADVGRARAEAGAERVAALNPDARVVARDEDRDGGVDGVGAGAGDSADHGRRLTASIAAHDPADPVAALAAGAAAARSVLRELLA
jgi:molybdopterin/thiamine biosynthesis adenylyltransferase